MSPASTIGESLEEFVANSQRYQAELLKFAIERYRRHKYARIGSLFQFMFMDCWPSITWSVLSYDRVPKQGYRALQDAYQPVLVGADIRRNKVLLGRDLGSHDRPFQVACWLVNDRHESLADCRPRNAAPARGRMRCRCRHGDLSIDRRQRRRFGHDHARPAARPAAWALRTGIDVRRQDEEISRNSYPIELVGHRVAQSSRSLLRNNHRVRFCMTSNRTIDFRFAPPLPGPTSAIPTIPTSRW